MVARPQRTIARDVEITGFGFFTGEDVRVRFRPARVNTGIVFVRCGRDHWNSQAHTAGSGSGVLALPAVPHTGSLQAHSTGSCGQPAAASLAALPSTNGTVTQTTLAGGGTYGLAANGLGPSSDAPEVPVRIPASIDHVARRPRRTTIREGNVSIDTTEHCMAALAGLGIDNLVIEIDAGELPGIDGSALGYVREIQRVGLVEQDVPRVAFAVPVPVCVQDGEAMLAALPGPPDELTVTYCLDLRPHYGPDCPIPPQTYSFRLNEADFVEQVAPARTWLLEQEVAHMRGQGLGQRVTEKDVLVMGRDGPVGNTLRFADELVRHKVLDLLGDLYLLARPVSGVVYARGSGHALNHELVRKLSELMDRAAEEKRRAAPAVLDVRQVQRILPHRYPMLLVDRVLELEDTRAVGIKNVTINEQFFQGHYPGTPVMPGVLITEAMAQLAGVLLLRKLEHTGKVAYMVAMDKVKIRRPVVPGDQLLMEAVSQKIKSRVCTVTTRASVANRPVAEAELTFMLGDADAAT